MKGRKERRERKRRIEGKEVQEKRGETAERLLSQVENLFNRCL